MTYIGDSTFLTIHFKHFDFIEWFDLNSNPKGLFKRLSISDFLDLLILIILQSRLFSIINCLLCSLFKICVCITIFINFYSKFAFKKVKIKYFSLTQYWVYIISPSNATCNALIISCLVLYSFGSNHNFSWNSQNCFDASLRPLIFLSAKSFLRNVSHGRNFVLGINSYLYLCLFGSHLSKIATQLL